MNLQSILYDKAEEGVRKDYLRIKKSLCSNTLPIFFTYFGPFPEYLHFIALQIEENMQKPYYIDILKQIQEEILPEINAALEKSEQTLKWLERYKATTIFSSFQKDLSTIIRTNIAIALIFLALRESAKGWALAQKKLPSHFSQTEGKEKNLSFKALEKELVLNDVLKEIHKSIASADNKALIIREQNAIERNILVDYFRLCEEDFAFHQNKEYFLSLRVQLEKTMLTLLKEGPVLIFSPYNAIVKFTEKYDNFYEFLYSLSDTFPTLAMQRVMFSGYMMV